MDLNVRAPFISWKGVLFFAFVGLFMLLGQTTVGPFLNIRGYMPDMSLILVIYAGFHAPIAVGASIAVGLGFLRDAAGGGVFGFQAGIFLAGFVAANLIRRKLDPTTMYYQAFITLTFALGAGLISLVGLNFFGWPFRAAPQAWSSPTAICLISAILTAAVGPVIYWVLERLRPASNMKSEDKV